MGRCTSWHLFSYFIQYDLVALPQWESRTIELDFQLEFELDFELKIELKIKLDM